MIYLIISGIVILIIIVLIFIYYKNQYQTLFQKIEEAENNLDLILEMKTELLIKLASLLEKEKIKDIPDIVKLKSKKLNHRELYSKLNELGNELIKLEEEQDYVRSQSIKHILEKLDITECDLRAILKYHNDQAIEINHYIHHFPSNIIKLFLHYHEIELYKLEKREQFEILKEPNTYQSRFSS